MFYKQPSNFINQPGKIRPWGYYIILVVFKSLLEFKIIIKKLI